MVHTNIVQPEGYVTEMWVVISALHDAISMDTPMNSVLSPGNLLNQKLMIQEHAVAHICCESSRRLVFMLKTVWSEQLSTVLSMKKRLNVRAAFKILLLYMCISRITIIFLPRVYAIYEYRSLRIVGICWQSAQWPSVCNPALSGHCLKASSHQSVNYVLGILTPTHS